MPQLTGKDLIDAAKSMQKVGSGYFGTKAKAKVFQNATLRRAYYNPNMRVSAGVGRAALKSLQPGATEGNTSATAANPFARWKNVHKVLRDTQKKALEAKASATEEKEEKVDEETLDKRKKAARYIAEQETKGKEEAVVTREIAKHGGLGTEEERKAVREKLADTNPRELTTIAHDPFGDA